MARKVFFSFHYERDIWRTNVVRNHSCPNCVFDRRGFQSEEEVKALLR